MNTLESILEAKRKLDAIPKPPPADPDRCLTCKVHRVLIPLTPIYYSPNGSMFTFGEPLAYLCAVCLQQLKAKFGQAEEAK